MKHRMVLLILFAATGLLLAACANDAPDGFLDGYTQEGAPPSSVHILKDGVVKLEYKRTADKDYEIVNITYREDFILEGLDGKTDYRIAPADYLQ